MRRVAGGACTKPTMNDPGTTIPAPPLRPEAGAGPRPGSWDSVHYVSESSGLYEDESGASGNNGPHGSISPAHFCATPSGVRAQHEVQCAPFVETPGVLDYRREAWGFGTRDLRTPLG
jgi:hypothetical protein